MGEHFPWTLTARAAVTWNPHPQTQRMTHHRNISDPPDHGVAVDTLATASGQWRRPSSSRLQNTTVTSPSTAASVIVTPNSTVRTIVSATTAAGNDVGSDTGLPGR